MKTAINLGTRPESTRMSPVVRECKRQEVGILANLDDARNPPFEPYRDLLVDAGCSVTVHDPYVPEYPGVDISHELSDVVRGADVVAILTGHDEYFSLDAGVLKGLMGQERPVVVDGRNVVDADGFIGAGFVYKGIGRGDRNEHQMKCS